MHTFFSILRSKCESTFKSTSMRRSWKILIYARSCLLLISILFLLTFFFVNECCRDTLASLMTFSPFHFGYRRRLHTHMALTELKTSFIKYAFFFFVVIKILFLRFLLWKSEWERDFKSVYKYAGKVPCVVGWSLERWCEKEHYFYFYYLFCEHVVACEVKDFFCKLFLESFWNFS
jgi:hypothetical protein